MSRGESIVLAKYYRQIGAAVVSTKSSPNIKNRTGKSQHIFVSLNGLERFHRSRVFSFSLKQRKKKTHF